MSDGHQTGKPGYLFVVAGVAAAALTVAARASGTSLTSGDSGPDVGDRGTNPTISDSQWYEEKDDFAHEVRLLVEQDTRRQLIRDIIGHPKQSPSLAELSHANPTWVDSTISKHLDQLVKYGVVKKLEIPSGERKERHPFRFYMLTTPGVIFLQYHRLLPPVKTLQSGYSQVEKNDKIKRYEATSREPAVVISDSEVDVEKATKLERLAEEYRESEDYQLSLSERIATHLPWDSLSDFIERVFDRIGGQDSNPSTSSHDRQQRTTADNRIEDEGEDEGEDRTVVGLK